MLFCKRAIKSFKTDINLFKSRISFAAAMSEALASKEKQIVQRNTNRNTYKSRYNGRSKKRQWEDYSKTDETIIEKRANFDPAERIKKKKTIILLAYSGVNYFGMQRNPGQKTIEEDLFLAMLKNKWINQDGFDQAQQVQFQRAARTDKGVSAARQICSVKLPDNLNIEALNTDLPNQIRVMAIKRVTKGFNAKEQCDARTYSYTLPTAAFANYNDKIEFETFRTKNEKIKCLNEILNAYIGTKNFHNFTSRKEYLDPSAKRFIVSFECSEPFLSPDNIEFATIRIKGQSFMMHQIRKMIGLALAILRGHTKIDTLTRAFSTERLDIPMAPGLGLVLDQVHYDRYNERYGNDGIHEPLNWDDKEMEINEFIAKYINSTIFETEFKEKPMLIWLETLGLHSYDVRVTNVEKNESVENLNIENLNEKDNIPIVEVSTEKNTM